jgi:hypothetical protein
MDRLGIIPFADPATHTMSPIPGPLPMPDLKLHDLENALANLTAALYWSGKHLDVRASAHQLTLVYS